MTKPESQARFDSLGIGGLIDIRKSPTTRAARKAPSRERYDFFWLDSVPYTIRDCGFGRGTGALQSMCFRTASRRWVASSSL